MRASSPHPFANFFPFFGVFRVCVRAFCVVFVLMFLDLSVTSGLHPVLLLAGWVGNLAAPVSTSLKVRRRLAA